MSEDEQFFRRAMRLAMNGRGSTEPNPSVGCILVKNGRVIGEGYSAPFGGPHAEPTALADCASRGESAAGATAYVTMEPCCHLNKKTPPCAPRLIEARIARVVIGCLDPNPDVDGKGIAMLREAGIVVDRASSAIEAEAKQLIAPFIKGIARRRPYVTLKWAQAFGGQVAGPAGVRIQISNPSSTAIVHQLRARCDAIMVGANTVLKDDPMLTARGVENARARRRCVLDPKLRIPLNSQLVTTASSSAPVLVFCLPDAFRSKQAAQLRELGIQLREVDDDCTGRLSIPEVMMNFGTSASQATTHLLVEPGPTLAASMLPFADRLWIIYSPVHIDTHNAPRATSVPNSFIITGEIDVDGDRLVEYLNTDSPVYFSNAPSADFVLARKNACR